MSTLGKLIGTTTAKKARRKAAAYIAKAAAAQKPYADWGAANLEDWQDIAYAPDKSKAYSQMLSFARTAIRQTGTGGNMAQMGSQIGSNMPRLFAALRGSLQQSYGVPVTTGAQAAQNISSIYSQGAGIVAGGYMAEGGLKAKTGMSILGAAAKGFSFGGAG